MKLLLILAMLTAPPLPDTALPETPTKVDCSATCHIFIGDLTWVHITSTSDVLIWETHRQP